MTPHSLEQYWAVKETAGWMDLSARGKILVKGPDRVPFLQAMLTNDIGTLPEYRGLYSLFLQPTGKIVADLYCYRLPQEILIDTSPGVAGRLVGEVDKFIVMDEVELSDTTGQWRHLSVHGPGAPELVFGFLDAWLDGSVMRASLPVGELGISCVEHAGVNVFLTCRASLGERGLDVLFRTQDDDRWKEAWGISAGSFPEVGPEAAEALRLERGIPQFGVDFTGRNNPIEAGLQHALSFTKGCYVGQEVVSKATYVGGVSRRLVRLRLDDHDQSVVPPGIEILDERSKKVGVITSGAYSPEARTVIAFGYVKRALGDSGTRGLFAAYPGGKMVGATVI